MSMRMSMGMIMAMVMALIMLVPMLAIVPGHKYFVTPWNSAISSRNSRGKASAVSSMQ